MELLSFLFGLLILFSALIMPWINRSTLKKLEQRIERIESTGATSPASPDTSPDTADKTVEATATTEVSVRSGKAVETDESNKTGESDKSGLSHSAWKERKEAASALGRQPPSASQPESGTVGFERQFGTRLPVWTGGIALLLSGMFLVKYSIDNDLLSPTVRITLGAVLGIVLIYAAKSIRNKPGFANGVRIAQSLTGAGIAILYFVSFAASQLYELIPTIAGFGAMALTTAAALVLSLRHGAPIALLGMVGGFLTPALLSTESGSALTLFAYLYFTASALLIVIRKTKWWWLSIPTIVASLAWVIAWLFSGYTSDDSIWLILFLGATSATIIINSRHQYAEDCSGGNDGNSGGIFSFTSILNYIALTGSLLLVGVITGLADFALLEWGLFGLLAVGGIILAYFNNRLYGFVPCMFVVVTAVMLFSWQTYDYTLFTAILLTFAAIYAGSGYFLMFRSGATAILWAGVTAATALLYYLLAYHKIDNVVSLTEIPLFWGVLALFLAATSVYVMLKVHKHLSDYKYRDHIYAIFSVTATSFVSLALFIELEREFFSVAVAGEVLALAWINNMVSIRALRKITGVLAVVFGVLLLPQLILLTQITIYSLIGLELHLQSGIPIVHWPLFQLALPAVALISSSYMLRKQSDDKLTHDLEVAGIALIAVTVYYLTRNMLHPDQDVLFIKAGFLERGIITNVLFVFGLTCLWVGRKYMRLAFSRSGVVVCGAAMFRIIYFDILLNNPLWDSTQYVGGTVIFNYLLLPFGLPAIWSYITMKELQNIDNSGKLSRLAAIFVLMVIFVLISMNIRYAFHGELGMYNNTSNAEIYTYSAIWLVFGISLLSAGIINRDKMLRYASLVVILLSVGKVFLYDASELEGLYRVFSFFGLGVSLIGLSYFYSRFVFTENTAPEE